MGLRLQAPSRLSFTDYATFSERCSAGIGGESALKSRFCVACRTATGASQIPPGTPDGEFLVLYRFPAEELREILNATVHGFICTALVSTPTDYRLYWGVYVRHVSWLTRPYLLVIEPFRWILYPAMLRRIRRNWISSYGLA
jgi:hypothetical protein